MSAQMVQTIGSVLLHFLWQGAALAVLLLMAISFTRNARLRYLFGVGALTLMALCPLGTVAILERAPVPVVSVDYSTVAPAVSNITEVLSNTPPVSSFDLLSCLVWIWCGGVCIFGARAFGGWLMLQRLRRTAQEAISPALLERCRRLKERIGINAVVRFAYSDVVDVPAVVGWFRPVVLIPLSAMSGLSVEQLDAIIAHELAHIRRYDALVNLFQIAMETVLFYHPAVWWVNRVIRTERENCCDDIAVAVCGNASEYARALAMMSGAQPKWAMAANGGALKARVGRLLGMQKMAHGIPRAGLAVLALLCASCVVLAAGVFRQDPPSPPPPPPPPNAPASAPAEPYTPSAPQTTAASTTPAPLQTPATPATPPVTGAEPLLPPEPPTPPEPPYPQDLTALKYQTEKIQREINRGVSEAERIALREQAAALRKLAKEMAHQYDGMDLQASVIDKIVRDLNISISINQDVSSGQPAKDHTGPSYIDSLASAGLTNLSVDDLIALKTQGVTADYVRQMKEAGFQFNIHELIGLKIQGVSPEYIRDIRAAGLNPNTHEIQELKIQGVTPDYIRQLKAEGFDPNVHEIVNLKIQGVSPEYIREIRATGLKPNAHEITEMKIQSVTPEFVHAMQSAGLGDLKVHDFISAKIQGVTPEFIEKVRAHGFKDLTLRQLISLKIADVF